MLWLIAVEEMSPSDDVNQTVVPLGRIPSLSSASEGTNRLISSPSSLHSVRELGSSPHLWEKIGEEETSSE